MFRRYYSPDSIKDRYSNRDVGWQSPVRKTQDELFHHCHLDKNGAELTEKPHARCLLT